jgi:hypothetical protein
MPAFFILRAGRMKNADISIVDHFKCHNANRYYV